MLLTTGRKPDSMVVMRLPIKLLQQITWCYAKSNVGMSQSENECMQQSWGRNSQTVERNQSTENTSGKAGEAVGMQRPGIKKQRRSVCIHDIGSKDFQMQQGLTVMTYNVVKLGRLVKAAFPIAEMTLYPKYLFAREISCRNKVNCRKCDSSCGIESESS